MVRRYTGQGGPESRRLRYPVKRTTKLSKDANAELIEFARAHDSKPATMIRRAIMKDIYIWKANKRKREEAAAVLDGQMSLVEPNNEEVETSQ